MTLVHVPGKKKGKLILYALSTCVWCKKTKQLLDKMGVEYDYIYVDLLQGDEKSKVVKEQMKWNPQCSYPTLVLNEKNCIVGFKEDEIFEALK